MPVHDSAITHVLICSFDRYSLSVCYVSSILLGSGDPAVDKKDTALTSQSLTSSGEDTKHNNYANDHLSGHGVNSSQVLPCLQRERQVWAAPGHSLTSPQPQQIILNPGTLVTTGPEEDGRSGDWFLERAIPLVLPA